jgi:nitrite reductase/ring-hydroxylating ferredoxin subunit
VRFVVAEEGEIAPGGHKLVTVAGREIGVFYVDGENFALRHRCPHQGGPHCDGHLLRVVESKGPGAYSVGAKRLLQCPGHGWEFDIRTGHSWFDPNRQRVRRYPVSLEAETYPVEVDRRSIVVTIEP